jgi:hypothetical protein
MTFPLFYFIFSVSHLSILQDLKYSKAFSIKPKYFHEPISWKKCGWKRTSHGLSSEEK